jgi:tRNA nucleotidyltransferase (CCA-adding enzyme)
MSAKHPKATPDNSVNSGKLTVITTHVNADFDAMASMLAAQKLYPDALVIFPGSQEKNLRNFFVQSMVYLYNLTEIKDIDMNEVDRLVLVDTRRADRIGKLSQVLQNPSLKIHIFDHHPSQNSDIHGDQETIRATGATITILTKILRDKNIDLTPEEATIMCLGIYEDTGSFTFSSTTSEDLEAASYLVSKGANINIIADLIAREISPEQIGHLNDLIQSATRHHINGVEIVVTTTSFDHYLPDFAFLIHKMVKMEDINAIFALALMENKVYVVARSRTEEVDVGAVLASMGGGGHSSAAALSVKGRTLAQVEQELIRQLYAQIKSGKLARHLMSSPAIAVNEKMTCSEANDQLTRYNVNALLVTPEDNHDKPLLGYITRQVIEKAIFHHLGQASVNDYMTTEIAQVGPDADLVEVQEKIIGNKQRVLPVIENNEIIGVITRTDLLNTLVRQSRLTRNGAPDPFNQAIQGRTRNISNFLNERATQRIHQTMVQVGKIAENLGFEAYVVGGFVRDLFLYRKNEDMDIVIEGDGIAFAKAFASKFKTRIHTHKKFGTAVIIYENGYKIDVASARLEYYRSPAALPDVEMSSIKLDLFRRDFTINTLAIHLNPDKFGLLIDFFSAQKDLKDKAIRVLHNLSFVEDPTRVFRAIRFEQRFGFTIGKLTANLINNALKMDFFKRLSGRRVFSEIKLILEEENPIPAIVRMNDFGLLKVIHPSIVLDEPLVKLLNSTRSVISWQDLMFIEETYLRWAVYFMAFIHPCDRRTSFEICGEMALAPRHQKIICQDRFEALQCLARLENHLPGSPSDLYNQLILFKSELILYMMAITKSKAVKKAISKFFTQLRHTRLAISGKDLQKIGLQPGPVFRQTLEAVLKAKLNTEVKTHRDELNYAKQWIKNHQ